MHFRGQTLAALGAVAIAVLDVVFLLLLYQAIKSTPQFDLAFGLPAWAWFLPWLPLGAGIVAIGLLVLVARTFRPRSTRIWLFPILTAVGGLAVAAWFGWWGLLASL